MSALRQIFAVVGMNLRNLPQRTGASLVIVIGIAGVVGVLVSVLAMAVGFASTIAGAGSPDRALILSGGALQEAMSNIPGDAVPNILEAPGIARDAQGRPIAAAESLAQVQVQPKGGGKPSNVALRGVASVESELRPEIHLVAGRMFRPGLHELIVGRSLEERYGLNIGSHLQFQNGDWAVVGVFASSRPSLLDSEIFTDSQTLLAAYQRTGFQSITVRLAGPGALEQLKHALAADPTLHVNAYQESTYAAAQSRVLNTLLSWIGYFVGGMMAAGALFGALNSLYASVSARSLEIATLRAIGFSPSSVVVSVLAEALALSVAGGLLGALCAWTLFDGHVSSMLGGGVQQNPVAFTMQVTPSLVVLGIIWACVIGFAGGLFPAIRAARLPIARALNAVV
ncbi:MAG TPA: ABC transporter permease [Steroidobacteraceae bacterium]|nr:ABC transporter permease [Steroidobacteraceae bacterium]